MRAPPRRGARSRSRASRAPTRSRGCTATAQEAAYAYASAAAFYIVGRFGRKRYLELYDVFNDEDLPGRAGAERDRPRRPAHARRLAHRLERDLRDWIRTQSF